MANFGSLAAEIGSGVWGTAANFNGFRVFASLLLQRRCSLEANAAWYKEWDYGTFTEGATYIRLGGHHVGHRPIF